jgi:hypothetical protein
MIRKVFTFGMTTLSMISCGKGHADLTLTVSTDTDQPNIYPGGQTDSTTSGDLRYCINYILNEQAQNISQN